MPPAVPVRGGKTGYGTNGATAPAGSAATAGPRPAAERGLCRVPAAPRGGGAPAGAAGPIGNPPVPLLRPCQNPVPAVPGSHRGQPDPGGRQSWVDGRNRLRWSQRRQRQVAGMVNSATAWRGQIWTLSLLVSALLQALESTKCQYRQETTSHVGGRGHPRAIALRNTKLPPPAGRAESRDGVRAGRTGHQIGAWSDRALGVKGGGMLGQWYTLSPPPPVWEMPKTRLTRSEGPPTPSPG